ncbi:MAG: hypothetical protein ACYCT9_04660 [Leptospirillum sp.]
MRRYFHQKSALALSLLVFVIVSACTKPNAPTESNFESVIKSYLSDPKNSTNLKVQVKFPDPKAIIFAHTAEPTFPSGVLLVSDHSTTPRKVLCVMTPVTAPSSTTCGLATGTEDHYKKLINEGFYKKIGDSYQTLVLSQNPAQNPELTKRVRDFIQSVSQALRICPSITGISFYSINERKACNILLTMQNSNVSHPMRMFKLAHTLFPPIILSSPPEMKSENYPVYMWSDKVNAFTEKTKNKYLLNIGTYNKLERFDSATQPSADLSGRLVSRVKVFLTPKIHGWSKDLVNVDTSAKEFTFVMEQLTNGWKIVEIKGPSPG